MLKSLFGAAMKETFGVATQPEAEKPSAADVIQASILQETLGVAAKPSDDESLLSLALNSLGHEVLGVATQAELDGQGKVGAVVGKVTEQIGLETVGTIAAMALRDIQSGFLTQATAPEPDKPSLIARGLAGARIIWNSRKNKSEAKKTKKTEAAIAASRKQAQADDLAHAQAMAKAHKDSAQSQAQGAAAAIVTTQSLANFASIFENLRRSTGGTQAGTSSESPDVVDGQAEDVA